MNTRTKLFLDKSIAKPFAYLLNFLVRIVGKIARINHNLDKDFKTIAVCKFKGMGSIIQSTPMLQALRKKFPSAEIIYVSSKSNEAFLKKINLIDTVVVVDDSGLFKFIWTNFSALFFLIKKHPEVYFDLEIYSDYSTIFTTFSLSKNRIGFYLRSSTFRMGIYTHMMFFNTRVPVSKAYLQLSKILDCETEDLSLYNFASKGLQPKKLSDNYIVINPNASDLRLERRWGKQNFIDLISYMLDKYQELDILLIGSKDEIEYTGEISKEFSNKRLIDTSGKTSLDELISIIANAKLMITNDTGPMHIAFSSNTPVICFFGPCSPEQYGISKNAYPIYKPIYCSPCVHDFETPPCKGNNSCMNLISCDEVVKIVDQILNNQNPKIENSKFVYSYENKVLGMVNR
ncbi:MAG: glycosyltransferase family 9 protein [Bacteroidales bacterium]|nr:glycosyltransferase family 9 protein [Bacteroidales bacterium]